MPADKPTIFQNSRNEKFEYYTYGPENGYPVLYMHGAVPMPFSKDLSEMVHDNNLRVIVILRPGYGASSNLNNKNIFEYVIMLEELIKSLNLKRFDVLGLSAGAPYCYALAVAYPDLVARVHICAGIPIWNNKSIYRMATNLEKFLFFMSRHIPPGLIGKYGEKAMESIERKKGWKDAECGESMDDIFNKYIRTNHQGLGLSTNLQYKDWGFTTDKIKNKIYIYHSKKDEMVPFKVACKSAELLINSTVIEYENEEHSSEKLLKDAVLNIDREILP